MSVKFAVVREDPVVEKVVVKKSQAQKALMVASGGCTALSLKALFPELQITLFDMNVDQINLVQQKCSALGSVTRDELAFKSMFNIGVDNSLGLMGEFESLFRSFRNFLYEFVLPRSSMESLFSDTSEAEGLRKQLIANKYWPAAFELYFSDALLVTMFGRAAVQHADPGSYPSYFQQVIENGLQQPDYMRNYFLQHILLGCYVDNPTLWPVYLQQRKPIDGFDYVLGTLFKVPKINQYQVISLSNIFDWMSNDEAHQSLSLLSDNMMPGSYLVLRQLNNTKDHFAQFNKFELCKELSHEVAALDKSLFYNQINIWKKR